MQHDPISDALNFLQQPAPTTSLLPGSNSRICRQTIYL
jgi:hypothetical protein